MPSAAPPSCGPVTRRCLRMLAQAVLKSSSPESDEHELPKPSLRRQRRVAVPFWQPRGDNAENIAAPPTMRVDAKWIALAPMSGSIIPAC